tara:strand:+ start:617 stop:877 length:261 start_codon:yes stop_codon:yes gene_type:complete
MGIIESLKEQLSLAHEHLYSHKAENDALKIRIETLEKELFNLRQESESELNRAVGIIEELSEADSMGDLCKIVRCHGLDIGDNNGN